MVGMIQLLANKAKETHKLRIFSNEPKHKFTSNPKTIFTSRPKSKRTINKISHKFNKTIKLPKEESKTRTNNYTKTFINEYKRTAFITQANRQKDFESNKENKSDDRRRAFKNQRQKQNGKSRQTIYY